MKLSLRRPAGATATGIAGNEQMEMPEQKEAAADTEKPSVLFLLISIAAMLAVSFTVLLMSVQFANMYHGANIKIPGL